MTDALDNQQKRADACPLCNAARITTGQNVCDGSFPFECGSVVRGAGMREPDVRRVGDRCARWARDLSRAVAVMDTNYREMNASVEPLRAERDELRANLAGRVVDVGAVLESTNLANDIALDIEAQIEGELRERARIKAGADELPFQIIEGMRYVALESVRGLCDGTPGRGL